jgi:gas vesicle protein
MNLNEFDKNLLRLTNRLCTSFYKKPSKFQSSVYGKVVDYQMQIRIITERLEEELKSYKLQQNNIFSSFKENKKISDDELEKTIDNIEKLRLDLLDYYIYTRMFLDSLTVSIKLSFLYSGNKNAANMKNSIKCLLNKQLMESYKQKISPEFFSCLEEKIKWIPDFRNSRDGLVHKYHYFVMTENPQGQLGYEIIDEIKESWGSVTVKSISLEVQKTIDNLSELLRFLSENLPRCNRPKS